MKQVFSIASGKPEGTAGELLSLRLGERHFGFAITNAEASELYQLHWHTDVEMDENALREIYTNYPELRQSFGRVVVCYDHPQSLLVPQAHYRPDDAKPLLTSMYGVSGNGAVLSEPVTGWQLQNVYAVPGKVQEWILQHFPNNNHWHAYTIGLKNIAGDQPGDALDVDLRTDDFTVLASRGRGLLLAQTFPYSTPSDIIYYLLDICRQFSLSQETVNVALSGLIDQQSALYKELYQYFLQLRFREPSWQAIAGEQQYPLHFFTSLNDLARCAS